MNIGRLTWAIADGYIPGQSTGPEPQMTSHDTLCFLNVTDKEANVKITVFFSDQEPRGPYKQTIQAKRTKHVRFNSLKEPLEIPKDTDFAALIESDVPIIVQQTRLDSRQAENALFSTVAFSN